MFLLIQPARFTPVAVSGRGVGPVHPKGLISRRPLRSSLATRTAAASNSQNTPAAPPPDACITPQWLQSRLKDVALLDLRPYDAYLTGHVPGAMCWRTPFQARHPADTADEGPTVEDYVVEFESRGVGTDRPVSA
jgi:hypothetical protein